MTDIPTALLHPCLRKPVAVHRRRLRLLGMLLFLTMAGALMFGIVTASTSQDFTSLLLLGLIGLILLPIVALLGGLMWYLDHELSRSANTANQLLRDCAPLTARLTPLERVSRDGVLAMLQPLAGESARAEPVHALINPSFRWSAPPRQEVTVELYCRALQPNDEWIALQSGNSDPLLGKIVDLAAYRRRMRWLKIAVLILLVLTLAVAVGRASVHRSPPTSSIPTAMASSWPTTSPIRSCPA